MDKHLKISYLGIPGSYSHQACSEFFPQAHYDGKRKFEDIIKAADTGEVDYAVLPVENSSAGRVTEVYNLLPQVQLKIIAEYLLPIHHNLLVPYKAYRQWVPDGVKEEDITQWKNAPLSEKEREEAFNSIKEINSHPQALLQCSDFIDKNLPKVSTFVDFDTATAAQKLALVETKEKAVIASRHAADIYNLMVLAENIENDPNNMTRFLVFGKKPFDSEENNKNGYITSLLFQTNHKPGALISALEAFSKNRLNLTKLETYMVSQELPYPTFYVDVGRKLEDPEMQSALKDLENFTTRYDVLGSYPASPMRGQKNSFLPVQ